MAELGKLLTLLTNAADLRERTTLLILQPTPFCNIDCEYCYLPSRNDRRRMSPETAGTAVRWLYSFGLAACPLTIVWHSGEPLTAPADWYEEAFAACAGAAPSEASLRHALQTNGMLIDDRWCRFFIDQSISLGVSIDGPAWLHDRYRKDRRGRGTHDATMRGVSALNRHGVPFHAICVVTEAALEAADAIMDFFESIGVFEIGFNVDEQEAGRTSSSLAGPDIVARYSQFIARVIERSERPGAPAVREFRGVLGALLDPAFGETTRNDENDPFRIVTVLADGRISTFSPEMAGQTHETNGELTFGNVHGTSVEDILASAKYRACASQIAEGVRACRESCQYFRLCGGGAPANKLAELKTFGGTETQHCRLTRKAVAEAALTHIRATLKTAG